MGKNKKKKKSSKRGNQIAAKRTKPAARGKRPRNKSANARGGKARKPVARAGKVASPAQVAAKKVPSKAARVRADGAASKSGTALRRGESPSDAARAVAAPSSEGGRALVPQPGQGVPPTVSPPAAAERLGANGGNTPEGQPGLPTPIATFTI